MSVANLKVTIDSLLCDEIIDVLKKTDSHNLVSKINIAMEKSLKRAVDKKKTIESNREVLIFKTKNKIKKAVEELKEEGGKVNPNSVSKKSGVATVTINKYKELLDF